jgi:hypothetical protein
MASTASKKAMQAGSTNYYETHTELNSHADTCIMGKECLVIHETHRLLNVVPCSDMLGGMDNKPIISTVLAYDKPMTGVKW